ncbi:hypothetical protein LPJ38_12970 [Bradyrhizobium daqingense]|uniref:Uncharacterized protein n=1 Tax=Bradyrhizobium daqingense TaxID=993502 RepID=A0A562KRL8_9BRAD|nr:MULTISPECIES: hypothetical protein [Bradyrhizobium]MDQ8731682.1 hypothetical protein [Bradyrhizobium sp. LHD-71]TWH97905.1 hypothetical protein IQ17_06143 [Bradyrhizobium daqingense]UFS93042.1 hypothetical protein LPJ38_12970 [Bradyrhizobium daqingense]
MGIASQSRSAKAQELAGKPAKTDGRISATALPEFTCIAQHPFGGEGGTANVVTSRDYEACAMAGISGPSI